MAAKKSKPVERPEYAVFMVEDKIDGVFAQFVVKFNKTVWTTVEEQAERQHPGYVVDHVVKVPKRRKKKSAK